MSIYLHIGMPKTASSYLKVSVFSRLDPQKVIFNPPKIINMISACYCDTKNTKRIELTKNAIDDFQWQNADKCIFISEPKVSAGGLTWLYDHREAYECSKVLFPKAHIIFFMRYQPDWLYSQYKNIVQQGHCIKLENFLNYESGRFKTTSEIKLIDSFIKVFPLELNYAERLKNYKEWYGEDNVHSFFFENFKENPEKELDRLYSILKLTTKPIISHKPVNPGLTAPAIYISLFYKKILKFFHINLPYSINPSKLDYLLKEKLPLPLLGKIYEKIRLMGTWMGFRMFMQYIFPKIIPYDFDLMKKHGIRKFLNQHYTHLNKELLMHFKEEEIPKKYLYLDTE